MDRNWTMTFPIEAAVFVVTLVAIVVIGAASFFLSWGTSVSMQGGGFDGVEQEFREIPVITTTVP